jgi:hypothetical protein
MDDSAKRRFDAVATLWEGCWNRITERRVYEWRATFALWTALALLISTLFTQVLPKTPLVPAGIGVLGLSIVVFHSLFLAGVGTSHANDRDMAIQRSVFREWSRKVQATVSLLLWLTALLLSVLLLTLPEKLTSLTDEPGSVAIESELADP